MPCTWPGQADVARFLAVSRARVGQIVGKVVGSLGEQGEGPDPSAGGHRRSAGGGGRRHDRRRSWARRSWRPAARCWRGRSDPAWRRAVARAAVEVERTMAEPRYLVRRDDDRALVALHPVPGRLRRPPGRPRRRPGWRGSARPAGPRLAGAAGGARPRWGSRRCPTPACCGWRPRRRRGAAVSSRQEIYPRGMEALRALKLAQGALGDVKVLPPTRSATAWPVDTRRPSPCPTGLDSMRC